MKKLLTILFISAALTTYSQDNYKGHVDVLVGNTGVSGELSDEGGALDGMSFGLKAGYRFTERFGAAISMGVSGHDSDMPGYENKVIGVGHLALGPMVSYNFGDKFRWDFKPMWALTSVTATADEMTTGTEVSYSYKSHSSFLLSNSINFLMGKGFGVSLNVDWLSTGNFDEGTIEILDEELTFESDSKGLYTTTVSIGLGYRF